MSGIPALEGAAALVGRWELAGPHGACTLLLSADGARLEAGSLAAPMHSLVIEGDCGELPEIAGWRPIPLGLELDDARGFATLVFERRDGQAYRTTDGRWSLRRD